MVTAGDLASGNVQNRYYPRIEIEIILAYHPVPGVDEAQVVKTKTLGLGGLMFEDENHLPVGSTYHLDLVLGESRMEVGGRVIYSLRVGPNLYQNGFAFLEMEEGRRERLTNFFLQEYEKAIPGEV